MFGAVDLLASEYGWDYENILYKIYPEDFFMLSRQIRIRKLDEHLINIMIAAAPHSENKEFIDSLIKTQRFMRGEDPNPQIDRAGLDSLKQSLSSSKMIGVKKV